MILIGEVVQNAHLIIIFKGWMNRWMFSKTRRLIWKMTRVLCVQTTMQVYIRLINWKFSCFNPKYNAHVVVQFVFKCNIIWLIASLLPWSKKQKKIKNMWLFKMKVSHKMSTSCVFFIADWICISYLLKSVKTIEFNDQLLLSFMQIIFEYLKIKIVHLFYNYFF